MKRTIRRSIGENKKGVRQVSKELDGKISKSTIHRQLKNMNIKYKKMKRLINLKTHHKLNRIKMAKFILSKSYDFHQQIIFSDEKVFRFDGSDNDKYYWHDIRFKEKNIFQKVQWWWWSHGLGSYFLRKETGITCF